MRMEKRPLDVVTKRLSVAGDLPSSRVGIPGVESRFQTTKDGYSSLLGKMATLSLAHPVPCLALGHSAKH